ncbi:MAG: hypothetical protein ACQES9_01975 [Myxococcota bacterium]
MLSVLAFSLSLLSLFLFWAPFPLPIYVSSIIAGTAVAVALSQKNPGLSQKRLSLYTVIISSLTIIMTIIFYLILVFNP